MPSLTTLYGNTGNVTVSANNLVTLYNATPGNTVVANVPDRNFTTLYATTPTQISPTRAYGNSNVEAFLNAGTDGANTVQNINMSGALNVGGQSNLGPVGNVHITGGATGYILATDGTGNLAWIDPSGTGDTPFIHFDVVANGNNQQFSNGFISSYTSNTEINLFKNGVSIQPFYFEKIGNTTIQVNILLEAGDSIDILASTAGGNGSPGGNLFEVQYNDGFNFAGSNSFTFDSTTNLLTIPHISSPANANLELSSNANTLTWTLDTDGNIVLPLGNSSINYPNGSPYGGPNTSPGGNANSIQINNAGNFGGSNTYVTSQDLLGYGQNQTVLTLDTNNLNLTPGMPSVIQFNSNGNASDGDAFLKSRYMTLEPSAFMYLSGPGIAIENKAGPLQGLYIHADVYFNESWYSTAFGNVNLGPVANLKIMNGNAGEVLASAGSNNLVFTNTIANANYANFAGTAYSVSGSNVSGEVANANYSNFSNVANTANSVNVANVAGIGNIATINLNGNSGQVLYGNGTFASVGVTANANYANFAGNVVNASQSNITSLGTLTSLSVSGTTSVAQAKEKFAPRGTALTGTYNFDALSGAIILQTANATANFTINFRGNSTTTFNTFASANESVSLTLINRNGATGYYANVIQIDSVTQTPVWLGGSGPVSGTINGYDMYNFNILKTAANTYVVFATVGGYD